MQLIQSNKKPLFHSSFKMTQDASVQMDLIKNLQHRQSVAKLRSGNHYLRIEIGRHCDDDDITFKYPNFAINTIDKTLFLFNNVDLFICKKLGYFIFEADSREEKLRLHKFLFLMILRF